MFGPRRRVRSIHNHRHSRLFVCGNLGMVLALEKGRCCDPKVLVNLRRWAAYLLGSFSRARVRWVVSELCPSDEDSRRWGPAGEARSGSSVALGTDRVADWRDGGPSQKAIRQCLRQAHTGAQAPADSGAIASADWSTAGVRHIKLPLVSCGC